MPFAIHIAHFGISIGLVEALGTDDFRGGHCSHCDYLPFCSVIWQMVIFASTQNIVEP
jgi:hypothetical protein